MAKEEGAIATKLRLDSLSRLMFPTHIVKTSPMEMLLISESLEDLQDPR